MFLIPVSGWCGGTISGTAVYQGALPVPKKLPVLMDSETCGLERTSQNLFVSEKGGLRNAVISIKGPVESTRSNVGGATLVQSGCDFDPHVLLVGANRRLRILNSDPIRHAVQGMTAANTAFGRLQEANGAPLEFVLTRAETFPVRSSLHPWMNAWVIVTDHSFYAVSDENGNFQIQDIPAGDYTLNFWHETMRSQNKRVRVREGETTRVMFRTIAGNTR